MFSRRRYARPLLLEVQLESKIGWQSLLKDFAVTHLVQLESLFRRALLPKGFAVTNLQLE